MKNLKQRDYVFVVPSEYNRDKQIQKHVVTNVGRTYFYTEYKGDVCKFQITDGIEKTETNYISKAFLTEQQAHDEKRKRELEIVIKQKTYQISSQEFSLETLETIHALLNPLYDINDVRIEVGQTVKTQQQAGGVLPPAPPQVGEVVFEKYGTLFHEYMIRFKSNSEQNFWQYISLKHKINEVIK